MISETGMAETFCVGTDGEFDAALDTAESNFEGDSILLKRGTYHGGFWFTSYQHHPITIRGGYNSDCSARIDDPANTVLDAGGLTTVLSATQHAGGGVTFEGLTIQNGDYWGFYIRVVNEYGDSSIEPIKLLHNVVKDCRIRGSVYIWSEPGDTAFPGNIVIADNVIQGYSGEFSAITVGASWTTPGAYVLLRNNIVAGNISTGSAGGVRIANSGIGDVYLTNNTVVDNASSSSSPFPTGGVSATVGTSIHLYNNVIYGNTSVNGPGDINLWYADGTGTGNAYSNIYTEIEGTWDGEGGNFNIDPDFVGRGFWDDNGTSGMTADDEWVEGDYHIGPLSPCIDAGYGSPPYPGSLPPYDFEGDPRKMDGNGNGIATVDIGADESPVIFADGLETGDALRWSESVGAVGLPP